MLREVKNKHFKPRILPFRFTTAATPSATLDDGAGDFTITRASAGTGTLTMTQPFSRNGIIIASQTAASGGYFTYGSTSGTGSAFSYSMLSATGVANDGSAQGFVFGWDSSDISICQKQNVAASIRRPRIIWAKVTGSSGAVAIGNSEILCTRTGTGVYVITYKSAFGRTPSVITQGISTANPATGKISSASAAGVTITMGTNAGAADLDFYFMAIGSDSTSDARRGRSVLQNSERFPRIVAFEINNSGGTWTCTTGEKDISATITDNGVGDFSVVLSEPFAREPAIFAISTAARPTIHTFTQATSTLRIQTRGTGGAPTDANGKTFVFMIGTQDTTEY